MHESHSLKHYALKLAKQESLPISNIDAKTGVDIINEITLHKMEMSLLAMRTESEQPQPPEEEKAVYTIEDQRVGKSIRTAFERNIIYLAKKYNIPFKKHDLSESEYAQLRDKIDSWTNLLSQAEEAGIHWDKDNYEPAELRQLIEEEEHNSYEERSYLNRCYYGNLL